MRWIAAIVALSVVAVIAIVVTSGSQSPAEKDFRDSQDDLQSASPDDFESDAEDVRDDWTDVKSSAQTLGDVNMSTLDSAWDSFSQTIGAVGGSGSAAAAQAQVEQSSQELQTAVQASLSSYDCST